MEGENIEDNPMLPIDCNDLKEDICTSSNTRSSGANKRKRGGDECKENEDAVYTFMRFIRSLATEPVSPVISIRLDSIAVCDVQLPMRLEPIDTNFLERVISDVAAKRIETDKMVLIKQIKAAFYRKILLRVASSAANARFLDRSSFRLLDKIFTEFASLWMNTGDEVKTKEQESQRYEFKHRANKIDNIVETDISSLGSIFSSEIFSEWQEFLSKEESTDKIKAEALCEALEDESFLHESVFKDIVDIHNSIFGSEDLVRSPGSIEISDADCLLLYEDSYSKLIKSAMPSSLDVKPTPEHLLHLSLDYKKNFTASHKPTHAYNFYKDSNGPAMAKMMELLGTVKEHILIHMTEWDDHPALQKNLDVIDMILGIPPSTPLAKALMALRFLFYRLQITRETIPKFSFGDQQEAILALALSWNKLEFESGTALLDEVQSQYEFNAEKLWLPLYSTLHCTQPVDLKKHNDLTRQRLEKYIRTSNIGEFRKRLQLLFAMHGQIKTSITQKINSSPFQPENENILYNIFGLYVQFLPLIMEYINVKRGRMELKLKELVDLCQWEQNYAHWTVNSKENIQKFKKIIQEYNDLLEQPLMFVLEREADRRGMTWLGESSPLVEILLAAREQPHFLDEDRSKWIDIWQTETDAAIKNLQDVRKTEFGLPYSSELTRIIESVSSSSLCSGYQEEMRKLWRTIIRLHATVFICDNQWKEKRFISDMKNSLLRLLKKLKSCGLSKTTTPAFLELSEPSNNMQHLLLTDGAASENNNEKIQTSQHHSLETEWRSANQNFFSSIYSFCQFQKIPKISHRDFSREEVDQALVCLHSLIAIQQEQRAAAYKFAARLESLKKSVLPLENLFSSSDLVSFPKNQHATFNCMWQQKRLFDGSCALLHDVSLFLRIVESSDVDTRQKAITKLLPLVEEAVLHFQKSKDSLDNYLLGKDRIVTSVDFELQPNGVTKQMEQSVLDNFGVVREFKECVSAFIKQVVCKGSTLEILYGHLESIWSKAKFIDEEYQSALRSRNHPEHVDEDPDRFVSGFVQALEQTYKDILDSFSESGSSNFHSVTENSLENWKAIFVPNMSSLKLEGIRDGLAKTIQFAGYILNCNGSESPGHVAHLKQLYSLVKQILEYGHGLLRDFLLMHIAVSQVTDVMAKMFEFLYSKGYPISLPLEYLLFGEHKWCGGKSLKEKRGTSSTTPAA